MVGSPAEDRSTGRARGLPAAAAATGNGAEPKTSIYDLFVGDPDLESQGVWFTHPGSGKKFKIAASENPKHLEILDALGEVTLRHLDNQDLDREEVRRERARSAAAGL